MKKIAMIIGFVFFNLIMFGQSSDSIKTKNLENEVRYIQLNLEKSHDEFQTGCFIVIGATTLYSISLLSNESNSKLTKTYIPLISLSMSLIGTGFIIHSHKYIGKAGLGVNGQGVTLIYSF